MRNFRIHLIRHGMTQGNLEGRYIGRTDLPLCQQGEEQLRQLAEQYEYPTVQKLYSSPPGPLHTNGPLSSIPNGNHSQSLSFGNATLAFLKEKRLER